MKRSTMLIKLRTKLESLVIKDSSYSYTMNPTILVDELLKEIEQNGLKPPTTLIEHTKDGVTFYIPENKWTPEDQEEYGENQND